MSFGFFCIYLVRLYRCEDLRLKINVNRFYFKRIRPRYNISGGARVLDQGGGKCL